LEFGKHYNEQVEMLDQIVERIQLLDGLSYAIWRMWWITTMFHFD